MRKLFKQKNKKGFAMAELLAVSIVLLFIFSILFSNYLPLVAEFETRLSYNDVTAQYAAHYIRKMYKEALEDPTYTDTGSTNGEKLKKIINKSIEDVGYYPVYSGDISDNIFNNVSNTGECERIIGQYGIEEIIITNYKLKDDTDNTTKYVKNNYEQKDGSLYNYIGYLPNYEKSIYTGKDENSGDQLYRIILKTKDFGYATTPILSDYKTPGSCFVGESNGDGTLTITDYKYNGDECGEKVIIKKGQISINTVSGSTLTGKIVKIGDSAFSKEKSKNIKKITLSNEVTSIGNSAFEGSKLEEVPNLNSVVSVGERAFANTQITKVDLSGDRIIGNYAFANNENLVDITLPNGNIYSDGTTLTKGLFAESGKNTEGIDVKIPAKMTNVGDKMFYLSNISKITLNEGVKTIGDRAFSQFNGSSLTRYKLQNKEITIPSTVVNIGYGKYIADDGREADVQDCFRGLGITSLSFTSSDNDLLIGVSAFRDNNITEELIIPSRVKEIGTSAFEKSNVSSLVFESTSESPSKLEIIGSSAFGTNNITKLELPDSIISIGEKAFEVNSSLSSVKLPNNERYTTISKGLFQGGNSFTSIVIPKNVEIIGDSAFNPGLYSSSLETVSFEKDSRLTTINGTAFANNDSLKEFTIPKNVSKIMNRAFASCDGLETITNNSSQVIDKLYSNGCEIFFNDSDSGSCSSSISDDRKNIVISYEKGYTVTITNIDIGGVTDAE